MGKRSLSELSVVATGVQRLEDRYGKRRRLDYDEDLPPITPWRCNLTASSQEHNLYFIAYGPDVHVYVPRYPTQIISEKPVLILSLQPSSPHLQGYLDPRQPHAINTLIVQRLGNDEVIATVRDDGDVDAVLIRHVLQAIERRAQPDNTIGCLADEIKPTFHENVGISAWGLAIHSQARVLAVSSNAHEVRIFKFGLLDDQRRTDVTQRVLNGNANIPCIAFCNTGDDPDARWLLATDLTGYTRAMDLHSTNEEDTIVQQFRFGRRFLSNSPGLDRLNAGWAIMFLDICSFQRENDFNTALGLREGEVLPGNRSNANLWDLSDTVDNIADNSPAFTPHVVKRRRKSQRSPPVSSQRGEAQSSPLVSPQLLHDEAHSYPDSEDVTMDDADSVDGGVALEDDVGQIPDLDTGDADETSEAEVEDEEDDDDGLSGHENGPIPHELTSLIDDDEDYEDEGTEDSISYSNYYGGKRIFGNQPYFSKSAPLCEGLPCPILHASVKNVYLLQPTDAQNDHFPFEAPMVGLANPLRQAVCNHYGYLKMFDRLNMTACIPSLGVVILASQKGRALVLALTKVRSHTKRSGQDGRVPDPALSQMVKNNYAMRVECILPFASQEERNQRPFVPLHGITCGPLQGTEDAPDHQKRWRLLMMYQDHSILSYEIRRPRVGRSRAADVEPVMV